MNFAVAHYIEFCLDISFGEGKYSLLSEEKREHIPPNDKNGISFFRWFNYTESKKKKIVFYYQKKSVCLKYSIAHISFSPEILPTNGTQEIKNELP